MQSPVVWPTFPGLGGLCVRRDLNIEITHDLPVGVVNSVLVCMYTVQCM